MKRKNHNYYFLVHSEGRLIQTVTAYSKKKKAIEVAKSLWDMADPESDDVKIFRGATGGEWFWRPE